MLRTQQGRQSKFTRKDKYGYLIMASLGLLVGGVVLAMKTIAAPVEFDPDTLCTARTAPLTHRAILVDRTDPLTSGQQGQLRRLIEQERRELQRGDRLSIYLITAEAPVVAQPVFSLCHPGDKKTGNELIENPRRLQRKYEDKFKAPLNAVIEDLSRAATAPQSPIMATIAAVTADPNFGPAIPRRTLTVFSDLLENTPNYSHYRGKPDWAQFIKVAQGNSPRPSLQGVDVRVAYLPSATAGRHQSQQHMQFWINYFQAAGAGAVQTVGR